MQPPLPSTIQQYRDWHESELHIKLDAARQNRYESSARWLREQTENSAFWQSVVAQLREFDARFFQQNGVYLLMRKDAPQVVWKPFDSLVDKCFRKNILANLKNWPNLPQDGWVTPDNWFQRVNDLIRTVLVVKYLDGVPFLASEVEGIARGQGLQVRTDYEAREEGYYASHTYVTLAGRIFGVPWDVVAVEYQFEIQVTTQLQEAIRPVTHPFYEARRSRVEDDPIRWQWQFDTDEFRANYLAHTLHHVEGLIVDVRNRVRRLP